MLIKRWEAESFPNQMQFESLLAQEGLDFQVEEHRLGESVREHRHSLTEIRILIDGELLFNISGNQIIIRAGDRIEIPANTRHFHQTHGSKEGRSLCAYRTI